MRYAADMTLAFGFATPWLAWAGLALAVGPVVLHWLHRRRYRLVPWAAMAFLLDSRRRNRRRTRFEGLVLLVLRCLILLLIAWAAGRPRAGRPLPVLVGRGATDHVLIVDDSASMGAVTGGVSPAQAAREQATRLARTLPAGDRLAIYRTSEPGEPLAALGAPADEASIEGWAAELSAGDTHGGLSETLEAAEGALGDLSRGRAIYVLSDFRRPDWSGEAGAPLRRRIAGLGRRGVRVACLDVAGPPPENLAVENLRLLDRHAIAGVPLRLGVTVRNHGRQTAEALSLRVSLDELDLPARAVAPLSAGASCELEFTAVIARPGPAMVQAELPADALAVDNRAYLALDARAALSVLIVDGGQDPDSPERGESYYLRAALDPAGDGAYGIRPRVLPADHAAGERWDDYDLVVLAGVRSLPLEADPAGQVVCPRTAELESYVRRGGGLIVFAGPRVDVDFYNRFLYADGAGLCPLPLAAAIGDATSRDAPVRLRAESIAAAPMLEVLRGPGAALAGLVHFHRYLPASAPGVAAAPAAQAGPARVLARYTDPAGSPAIVEQRWGRGAVLLFTSSAGTAWNDWPRAATPTYLPVMNEAVAALARPSPAGELTGPVGRPIVLAGPDLPGDAVARVTTPAFPRVDVLAAPAESRDGRGQVTISQTRWAGQYEILWPAGDAPPRRLLAARNVEPGESDLVRADPRDVPAVGDALSLHRLHPAAGGQGPREYWRWFLTTALVLLVLEVILARRFGHYPHSERSKP